MICLGDQDDVPALLGDLVPLLETLILEQLDSADHDEYRRFAELLAHIEACVLLGRWSRRIAACSSTFDICGTTSTFHREHPHAALARDLMPPSLLDITRPWIGAAIAPRRRTAWKRRCLSPR
ncbi:hypothetical protein GQF42_42180 [Streptomyces broussonetiae]|uniref:Uncharacterized protein n=1 Tax=Streptomyces broussonetiae TaxID=2686304 RepID=A0A6I6NC19_9ACTN|nr:hypothetical protein [Streptomyces broussonetiae]QHA08972.1 hypothetical protein GQF42_42180 [Streptomyces broussonetiae]